MRAYSQSKRGEKMRKEMSWTRKELEGEQTCIIYENVWSKQSLNERSEEGNVLKVVF